MPIDVGDAVLHFLGDTTQLDEAFARLGPEAEAAMAPAVASISEIGTAATVAGAELDATGQNAAYAGEEIALSMDKAAVSVRGVGEQARVAEEMIGVRLPRGVNRFMAELPGVQGAISAAFSVGVVYFLVEALFQVSEKLSDIISKTFIYTQAMRDSDAATVKMNQALLETAAATKKATEAIDEYGLTAVQKTQKAIDSNNDAWVSNTAKIRLNREEVDNLKKGQSGFLNELNISTNGVLKHAISLFDWFGAMERNNVQITDNREKIDQLNIAYRELMATQEQLNAQMKVLELQLRSEEDAARAQAIQKLGAYEQEKISAAKTTGAALLALQKAEVEASIAFDSDAAVRRLMLDKIFAEAEYQLDLSTRKQKLAAAVQAENQLYQITRAGMEYTASVQKTMGEAGVAAAVATNVQIEQLAKSHNLTLATLQASGNAEIEAQEKQHEAKLITDATKFKLEFEQIVKAAFAPGTSNRMTLADSMLGLDFNDKFKRAEEAAKQLGITLSGTVAENVKKAQEAFNALKAIQDKDVVSTHDLLAASLKLAEAKKALDKTMGDTAAVKADEKAIADLEKELKKFEGQTQKTGKVWDLFVADFKKKAKETGVASKDMAKLLADGAKGMQQAFESAMAAAILSEESFGEAMKKATEQVLAQISAQAAVKALYELAMAAAAAAIDDWAAASKHLLAAAKFAAVSAITGVAAHAMAGGGQGGGGGQGPQINQNAPQNQPAPPPQGGQNIPHLDRGGLITAPTLALLHAPEAVIPLNDGGTATNAIAEAIAKHMSGGNTYYTFQPKGVISADTLGKMAKKLSRQVQTGRARLIASNSHKITRRG